MNLRSRFILRGVARAGDRSRESETIGGETGDGGEGCDGEGGWLAGGGVGGDRRNGDRGRCSDSQRQRRGRGYSAGDVLLLFGTLHMRR